MSDNFENMGARMVREVASKTSDMAGDGATTATVLARAIYREGQKMVSAGINPMEIKRGIDKGVAAVIEELKKLSKPTKDKTEITQVGTISANNDPMVGKLISEAMEKVGKEDFGFNAETETYENLIASGVIDPTKVVRYALQNAASVAGLMITTEAAITEKPQKKSKSSSMPDMDEDIY